MTAADAGSGLTGAGDVASDWRPETGAQSVRRLPLDQRPAPVWLLVLLAVVTAGASAASAVFAARTTGNLDDYNSALFFAASGAIGALIVARSPAPARRVGWILLLGGLAFAIMSLSTWYAVDAYPIDGSGIALERLLAWPQTYLWVAGAGSVFLLLPLYYPDWRID